MNHPRYLDKTLYEASMNIPQWSKQEKQIARAAFDKAIERECAQLVASFRQRAADIKNMDDLWSIREELNRLWRELPEKYDYRYSQLTWVFARLIHEHWMTLDDLKGLGRTSWNRSVGRWHLQIKRECSAQ